MNVEIQGGDWLVPYVNIKGPLQSPAAAISACTDVKELFVSGCLVLRISCKSMLAVVSELQEEGMNAINLPLSPIPFELDPEDTMLEENEVRTMVDPNSRSDPKLQELMKVLIDWINDVLVGERIIVKDLAEDLYDGQVLQKLFGNKNFQVVLLWLQEEARDGHQCARSCLQLQMNAEKLESEKLNVAEVTQSEIAQKQKLQTVLEKINETLKLPPRSIKWNVDSVHAKSLVAILHLLVALSQYFRAPIRLPDHVSIQVVVVQKREGILQSRQIQEEITERDAFDTLFDHAPDKLNVVKKTLITFVNKHLNKLNLEVTELETQFADGVYLVLLMGLLEGYFVPLHSFFLTPDSFEQKVLNVSFAFELMQDGGLEKPKPRPEDIVNCDLKSTLRVLYNLFTKYRNVE
ncbi:Calponin-like integrin-linked kinase-binding protein [Macaca mulatta]|uniref:Calponin-like integrin-linked kinase-binding protein n=1 Tax=Macaca mulatta TaxID=9544 RepID=G7NDW5_MACMU|nr:Calponin-like integrin-linked kinase-binding protein [Macaca mulatta]